MVHPYRANRSAKEANRNGWDRGCDELVEFKIPQERKKIRELRQIEKKMLILSNLKGREKKQTSVEQTLPSRRLGGGKERALNGEIPSELDERKGIRGPAYSKKQTEQSVTSRTESGVILSESVEESVMGKKRTEENWLVCGFVGWGTEKKGRVRRRRLPITRTWGWFQGGRVNARKRERLQCKVNR